MTRWEHNAGGSLLHESDDGIPVFPNNAWPGRYFILP
jgi:hypothetical protein